MVTPTRPILRYHGGKWRLAPWIISHFPPHRVYVEPFGGAASVLLRKARAYGEVYNELSGEIVNLFRVVRDQGEELRRALYLTPFAREEYDLSFAVSEDPVEQARRTVVRSFMGFGSNALQRSVKSGFRSNSNRSGTTPSHDWANFPDALVAIIERLRGVVLECKDARAVMEQHDGPGTLHYCDPPYVHETRSQAMHGHHGYDHEMTDQDHVELAEFLHGLEGMVVLSGYGCQLLEELYKGWTRVVKRARGDCNARRTEVLWLSPNAVRQGRLWG